jgi:hypothetical protein
MVQGQVGHNKIDTRSVLDRKTRGQSGVDKVALICQQLPFQCGIRGFGVSVFMLPTWGRQNKVA